MASVATAPSNDSFQCRYSDGCVSNAIGAVTISSIVRTASHAGNRAADRGDRSAGSASSLGRPCALSVEAPGPAYKLAGASAVTALGHGRARIIPLLGGFARAQLQ